MFAITFGKIIAFFVICFVLFLFFTSIDKSTTETVLQLTPQPAPPPTPQSTLLPVIRPTPQPAPPLVIQPTPPVNNSVYWNCYGADLVRYDQWNDDGMGGGLRDMSRSEAVGKCNEWISECGNNGGCFAHQVGSQIPPIYWNCYSRDGVRRDGWNDDNMGGGLRGMTRQDAQNACGGYVEWCGNNGGCLAFPSNVGFLHKF